MGKEEILEKYLKSTWNVELGKLRSDSFIDRFPRSVLSKHHDASSY